MKITMGAWRRALVLGGCVLLGLSAGGCSSRTGSGLTSVDEVYALRTRAEVRERLGEPVTSQRDPGGRRVETYRIRQRALALAMEKSGPRRQLLGAQAPRDPLLHFQQFFEYTFFVLPEAFVRLPAILVTGKRHTGYMTFVFGPDDRVLHRYEPITSSASCLTAAC